MRGGNQNESQDQNYNATFMKLRKVLLAVLKMAEEWKNTQRKNRLKFAAKWTFSV